MAERQPPARLRVCLEYRSDRLQPEKLMQAYQLLVPERPLRANIAETLLVP